MITKTVFRTLVATLLFAQCSVNAAPPGAQAMSIEMLRDRIDEYVAAIRNLRAEIEVVRVARLTSGKLAEETFSVECLMRDYAMRQARYTKVSEDGEKKWFDICETLILASGKTVEWRHPGFPGHVAFGESSDDISLIRSEACRIGDPLYVVKRIRRVLGRDTAEIVEVSDNKITARVPTGDQDALEFEFSSEFDWLPVTMTRIYAGEKEERTYHSGGFFSLNYVRQKSGAIVPRKATYVTSIKDHVAGSLTTTWDYTLFDLSVKPTEDEMALKVPVRVMSANLDTEEKRIVTTPTDEVANDLKRRFGNYIQIHDRVTVMKSVAKSFVGQCPELPELYHRMLDVPAESIQDSSGSWRTGLLVLHAVGVLGITLYCRRRRLRSSGQK